MARMQINKVTGELDVTPLRALFAKHCRTGETVALADFPSTPRRPKVDRPTTPSPIDNGDKYHVCKIDWLRATGSDADDVENFVEELSGVVSGLDLVLRLAPGGMLGYRHALRLLQWANNELTVIGTIAYSLKGDHGTPGYMLDFTGHACTFFQLEHFDLWEEIVQLLHFYSMRITRADIALDLPGYYVRRTGLTVPRIGQLAANSKLFDSDHARNGVKVKQSFAGDWSWSIYDGVSIDDYDPMVHGVGGLTVNLGARSSPNFFRIYEKGKQLLGLADDEDSSIDKSWVRIEQEIKRDKDGNPIPFDLLLHPDDWFCSGRPLARMLLDEYRWSIGEKSAATIVRDMYKKERGLSLKKKVYWAKKSYGRLIRTLYNRGYSPEQIFSQLARAEGLKQYLFDIAGDFSGVGCES